MLGLFEMMLRRVQLPPWQPLYQMLIGFLLLPILHRLAGDDAPDWQLVPLLAAVLVALRVLPAVVRKVVPFSSDLQAQWTGQRNLAKRYDSYQWRKLLWIGLGLSAYVAFVQRQGGAVAAIATACVFAGGAGAIAWRRVAALELSRQTTP